VYDKWDENDSEKFGERFNKKAILVFKNFASEFSNSSDSDDENNDIKRLKYIVEQWV
jgi:hypothetical protein